MGYTIPGWLDEILDFIGINFPNVDEDDYREMADAMREFAEKFEGHGGDAHKAFSRILSSSEGWAVDSMEKHWNQIKASHLEKLPELARLFADACDVLAEIIEWMKHKAEAELAIMAGSVGLSIGLAWVTGGLSAILGAAEIQAMRQVVKRIIDEAVDRIVDEVIAKLTEPVNAKLEAMVEDMVLDLADGAFHMPPANGSAGGGHGGKGGMHLNSADGAGSGPGKVTRIDHVEFEDGAGKVSRHGSDMHTAASDPLGRVKGAFGRSKGRDPFTKAFDSVLHGAIKGSEKALKKISKHITETVPERVKGASRTHKGKDHDVRTKVDGIDAGKHDGGKGGAGGKPHVDGGRPKPLRDKESKASTELAQKARDLKNKFTCGDPIDMATGQMILAQTDAELPGILPLVLHRAHLSGYTHGISFGPSWASTLDERLEKESAGEGVWWRREDGSSLYYPRTPDIVGDRVDPVAGEQLPLTYLSQGTSYALVIQDPFTGLTSHFEASEAHEGTWWLTRVEDRNHNHITVERAQDDRLLELSHSGGYRLQLTTAEDSPLVTGLHALTDDGPIRLRGFCYDDTGDLTEVRTAVDAPARFTYDDAHRITGWHDSNDTEFRYVYDASGRVVETQGTDGILNSHIAYAGPDHDGITTATYTDSLGHATTYRANPHGQIVSITDALGHTVHHQWDARDRLLSSTDPAGHTTRWEWSDTGDVTAVFAPDGTTSRAVYNSLHLPVELTGPDGTVTRQDFDRRGNRVAVHTPDGATTTFAHHATGATAAVTGPHGPALHLDADAAGLPVTVTDARGARTTCTRDAFGRPLTVTDPLGGVTTVAWDAESRLTQLTAPDGTRESWTYDGEGNCTAHTGPLGGATLLTYGPFDLLSSRTTPDGATYTFIYDTERRLTGVTDPRGASWTYMYDARGEVTSETDFDGRVTAFTHDGSGFLVSSTTAAGDVFTFVRDTVGRLTAKEVAGRTTRYTYDSAGRLTGVASPDSALTRSYDPAGRLLAETVDGHTTHYRYDDAGRLAGRTTPTGAHTSADWDAFGNRTRVSLDARHTLSFTHDLLGEESERAVGDRVFLSSVRDGLGRVTRQSVSAQAGPGTDRRLLRDRRYTYRPDGFLTGLTEQVTGRTLTHTLDPVGRPLTTTAGRGTWHEEYTYDSTGNQTTAQWPDRAADSDARGQRTYTGTRVTRAGDTTYRYDEAGRLLSRTKRRLSRKPETWRYMWDAEDRLTSCTTPDGQIWHYRYDPLGRRTAKYRLANDGSTAVDETRFTWDGTRLAEETRTATGVTVTWEYDGHRPLAQYERKRLSDSEVDSRFFAIVTDLIGTPTELVTEDGEIAWHTRSTVWGTTAPNSDAAADTLLRFPGQYADPETGGLHYNYFRHYDPETARFVSPDPLGLEAGPNAVAYVLNPSTWFDLLGLLTCKQNAARLRANMEANGVTFQPGQAAAHIVPSGGAKGHWAPGARARKLLEDYDVDINDHNNGIPLNHPTPHNYTHRGKFLNRLDTHLQNHVQRLLLHGKTKTEITASLKTELGNIGSTILKELKTGSPGPTAQWTAP
jgi:RHS repeat-associated protein